MLKIRIQSLSGLITIYFELELFLNFVMWQKICTKKALYLQNVKNIKCISLTQIDFYLPEIIPASSYCKELLVKRNIFL